MNRYVWVTPDHDGTHTIHRAGCAHLRRIPPQVQWPLAATELGAAMAEAARSDLDNDPQLGAPEDIVGAAPCTRKAAR